MNKLFAFPFADEMSHGKMAIHGPGGSWLFSPETGDTETLKKSPGTAERMASLFTIIDTLTRNDYVLDLKGPQSPTH